MRLLPILAVPFILSLLVGCESERAAAKVEPAAPDAGKPMDDEQAKLAADIAALAAGKDLSEAKASKQYDDAIARLIQRGSSIETTLIDHLRRSEDWGVRLGLIEVLMATGTKVSVEHLIVCLDDPEPLVALRANTTLQEMTNHAEIPEGGGAGANGLPPVPKPPDSDLALDAELRQWALWHREHHARLRQAWAAWWATNKDQVTIK
jgi:hypothetical protein